MEYNSQYQNLNSTSFWETPINFAGFTQLCVYIYIVWIAFFGVWKTRVMGIPLYSLFFILVSVICFWHIFLKGFNGVGEAAVVFLLLMSVINSIVQGWPVVSSIYNAFLYVTPLIFLYLPKAINLDINKICKAVQVMILVSGIVSVLIYLGVIDSGLNLNLNITLIDNAIGLLGIATAFYLFSVEKRSISSVITLVLSVLIILIGQSRARMALAAMIIFMYAIFLLFIQKRGKSSNFLLLIGLGIVALFILYNNSDEILEYLDFSLGKFEEIGSDSSSLYRQEEMREHLRLFAEHPFFGVGCGAYYSSTSTAEIQNFSAHNMITGLLAMNGFMYGMVFIMIFLYAIIKTVKNFFEKQNAPNFFGAALSLPLLVLSITSAGFGKPATHIFMLLIGIILNDYNKESSISSENQLN